MPLKKFMSIILCVLWITFIFSNSSADGLKSNGISNRLLNSIKIQFNYYKNKINNKSNSKDSKAVNSNVAKSKQEKSVTTQSKISSQNYYIRRSAHLLEYFVLALLISNSFRQFKVENNRALIYIMFACLCTALLDEFYQSFIPGRTSSVRDVLLDFTGSMVGILFSYLTFYKNYRRSKRG